MAEFSGINKKFLSMKSIAVLIKVRHCALASSITVQAIFEVQRGSNYEYRPTFGRDLYVPWDKPLPENTASYFRKP